jgi:hypothetical protein
VQNDAVFGTMSPAARMLKLSPLAVVSGEGLSASMAGVGGGGVFAKAQLIPDS